MKIFTALLLALAPFLAEDSALDTRLAYATFDAVWDAVHDRHFDPTFNGVDWDAVGEELRPLAGEAEDMDALRDVLRDMLGRLEQSHFSLVPKEAMSDERGEVDAAEDKEGGIGIDVRLRDGRLMVTKVAGPSRNAGIRPGWILLSVDGKTLDDFRAKVEETRGVPRNERIARLEAWRTTVGATYGAIGTDVELELEDFDGQRAKLTVTCVERDVIPYSMPGVQLPPFYLHFERFVFDYGESRIGVIRFTNWFAPMQAKIDAAVEEMLDCDGIIVDLRGNTGGDGSMVGSTSGHFFEKRTVLGTMSMRNGERRYTARPRKRVFGGRVAILTDETTGSTSEVFTGGMQSVGRARVFGETSAGAVLPATTKRLPNGDGLLYAIGDFRTSKGELLEGPGVQPDVEVPLTRANLRSGRDATMAAAIAWIESD